jgi:hypothetical protein
MSVVDPVEGAAIDAAEMDRMMFPDTKTLEGGESRLDVPSKMRTFSKMTADCRLSAPQAGAQTSTRKMAAVTEPPAARFIRYLFRNARAMAFKRA